MLIFEQPPIPDGCHPVELINIPYIEVTLDVSNNEGVDITLALNIHRVSNNEGLEVTFITVAEE